MQLKCVAIDDEPLALSIIENYVQRYPNLRLVATFDDALSGSEFLRQNKVDILFLDINMPDITGLDLARALQQKPLIIFTTAYKNFAFEGFELEAFDYLLKPIAPERFARAIKKAMEYLAFKNRPYAENTDAIFVYSEYRMVKILLDDIDYIETMDDYIKIHLPHGKFVLTLMTLKKVLEKLPEGKFRRIHRSFIVPLAKVSSIQNKKVSLASGTELPISSSYADFIKEWSGLL